MSAWLCLLLLQDAGELVKRLESDRIEEREEAARSIRALGEAALEPLRRAAGHDDPEVRARIRDLIVELEWKPVLPLFFERWYPDGRSTLHGGTEEARRALLKDLLEQDAFPVCLAERLALVDPDPRVCEIAASVLCFEPRPRHREALFRLMKVWEAHPAFGRPARFDDKVYLPVQERLLEALEAVLGPEDRPRLDALARSSNRSVAGAAMLHLSASREELLAIVRDCSYPVSAKAREQLARRFGPAGLPDLPVAEASFPRWRAEEATLRGLLANGSPEAIRAVEEHPLNDLSSQSVPFLKARAGTEGAARSLLSYWIGPLADYRRNNAAEALRLMPAPPVLKAIAERMDNARVLAASARRIVAHGDEAMLLAMLRLKDPGSEHLPVDPIEVRPPLTAACRKTWEEESPAWARRFAFRVLASADPEGHPRRVSDVLVDPGHPVFLEAVQHFPLIPEARRRELLPALTRKLEATPDAPTLLAYGRVAQREWLPIFRSMSRSEDSSLKYTALHALADADLTLDERLDLALEHPVSFLWSSLHGKVPPASFDRLRDRATTLRPHEALEIALALVSSGDSRPIPRLREGFAEYSYGLAAVQVLLEGERCAGILRDSVPILQASLDTQAAGESVRALTAFHTPETESFLLGQLAAGPMRERTGNVIFGGYSPEGPPEDAILGLVNLRSEAYRARALRQSRLEQHLWMTGPWRASVRALGILGVEGGLEEAVGWLSDFRNSSDDSWSHSPYLDVLGYLGDERHADLARAYLKRGLAAARALDRLLNRAAYAPLRKVIVLRGIHGDPRSLARDLAAHWKVEVRVPEGHVEGGRDRRAFPVWRASGLEVLDAISDALQKAPVWRDGRVEFATQR